MKKLFIFIFSVITIVALSSCSKNGSLSSIEDDYPRNDVYYQIFVRSFADSDGDGIGDFKGITENLDYLEALGLGGIWLMPIHPSPSYHGYDVTDYYDVNEEYGTMADFEELLVETEKRGIKVMIDLVLNHTSNEHLWFEAANDPTHIDHDKYRDYYTWIDANDNRYRKKGSWGQNIWHNSSSGIYAGYFSNVMPDLNFDNRDIKNLTYEIGEFWLNKGVDGFRLDAALHIFGEGETTQHDAFTPNLSYWNYFRAMMREVNEDVFIIGEVWDAAIIYSKFYSSLDSVFNFELADEVINAAKNGTNRNYSNNLASLYSSFSAIDENFIDTPFLRNHDQDRVGSELSGNLDKMRLAADMYLTLPGSPFLYYGEEIGMKGTKSTGPYWDETRRLPLKWGNSDKTATWFDDHFNNDLDSIASQLNNDNSLLKHYQKIINVRNNSNALKYGKFFEWDNGTSKVQGFYRYFKNDKYVDELVFVIHNFSNQEQIFEVGKLNGEVVYGKESDYQSGKIAPYSTIVIKLNADKANDFIG